MEDGTHRDELYSNRVKAGKRTYFFDVKATKGSDLYLTITESKRKYKDDGTFFYEKHKLFLYKEDFDKFKEGLSDSLSKIDELKATGNFKTDDYNNDESSKEKEYTTDVSFDDI